MGTDRSPRSNVHYSYLAILAAYGDEALAGMLPSRAAALAADIGELARELAPRATDDYEVAYRDAAMLHARRVGGLVNLGAYLDCLHTIRL